MKTGLRYLFVYCIFVAVTACGGADGGGGADAAGDGFIGGNSTGTGSQLELARIDAANAEQLGTAATEGAKQAVQYQAVSSLGFRPAANSTLDVVNEKLSLRYAARVAAAPPAPFNCITGSVVETDNMDGSTTATFTMCDIGFGLVVDGVVQANRSTVGNITTVDLLYDDFSISYLGDVILVDFEAHCTTDNSTTETSCDFPGVPGFDGRIYDFSDSTVDGDAVNGYTITATIVDPDHGIFTITTPTPIVFGCANGQPMSGALQFTDGNDVLVTVTFNGCASFTVSYNGTSEIYNW
jgi:hypothetical protein